MEWQYVATLFLDAVFECDSEFDGRDNVLRNIVITY